MAFSEWVFELSLSFSVYSKIIIFGLKIGSIDASQASLPQLPTLSELDSRMQVLSVSAHQDNHSAESHPLLLYNGSVTLSDLFNRSNPQNRQLTFRDKDSDSTLSFQQLQSPISCYKQDNIDELVSQFVNVNLEKDIAKDELQVKEQKLQEASKTIELLKKLVILLDMEREVVVEDTENLRYKLISLMEENQELSTEAFFMKKEAVRLTRCMLKMRDEHFYKMSHLQNQIFTLQLSRESVYENGSSPSCFGLKSRKRKTSGTRSEPSEKKRSKWLKRLNTINPFTRSKCNICPSPSSSALSFCTLT